MLVDAMTDGMGVVGMGLMGLWMLLPAGMLAGVVWLVASTAGGRDRRSSEGEEAAKAILAHRLAAGEIDLDEYETAPAALEASRRQPDHRADEARSTGT